MQDHTSGHHRITAKSGKATKNNETGNCCKAMWAIINRRSRWFTDLYTLNKKIANFNHFHGRCVCCCVRWNTGILEWSDPRQKESSWICSRFKGYNSPRRRLNSTS